MDTQLLLPVGVALLATIAAAVAQISSHKKSDGKFQLFLSCLVIACLIANLGLTIWLLSRDKDEKDIISDTEKNRFITTMDTLSIVVRKSNLLLDSLRDVKDITILINDSLHEQLMTERKIHSATQELALSQNQIYQLSDRSVNPLFPLKIRIELEIPFNSSRMEETRLYFKSPPAPSLNSLFHFLEDAEERKTILTWNILHGFEIYVLGQPVQSLKNISSSVPQLNFEVTSKDLLNSDVRICDSVFYVTAIYLINDINRSNKSSNTLFGFNDLGQCYLGLIPTLYFSDYKIQYVEISSGVGLHSKYKMWLGCNNGRIEVLPYGELDLDARTYVQKIVGKESTLPKKMPQKSYIRY